MHEVDRAGADLAALTKDWFPLGPFGAKLQAVKRQLDTGPGFALIRGLPVERYTRRQATIIYWGIGLHLGQGVVTNSKGHLISHVTNLGATMDNPNQRGHETREMLPYHTDECDIVGLLCLQEAKSGGASTLASAVAIHNEIQRTRPDLLEVLYQPWYIDRRGEIPEGTKPYYLFPPFTLNKGRLTAWVQPRYSASSQRFPDVPRYTDAHTEAMKLVQTLADDPRFRLDMTFRRGDIQLLNNHVILHSRTEYQDFEDPQRRRHLLRLWISSPDTRDITSWHAARTPGHRFGVYVKDATPPNVPIDPVAGAY